MATTVLLNIIYICNCLKYLPVLNKEIPFIRILVPYVAGITAGLWFRPGYTFFILSATTILLALFSSFFLKSLFSNTLFGLFFSLAMFICGLWFYSEEKKGITPLVNEESVFTGILDEYPIEKANTYQLIIKLKSLQKEGESVAVSGSLSVYHDKDGLPIVLVPGDILTFRLTPVEITNRGNPCEFDYKFFMENKGIGYMGFTDSSDLIKISAPKRRYLAHKALIVRDKLMEMYATRGVDEERMAIIGALTLGEKSLLNQDQKDIFSKAGIIHVMSVSGLHAGIVSMVVMGLLFFLDGRLRWIRVIAAIISLWVFAFVTGLEPTVLRASLMFSFLHLGQLLKRPVNNINSVLASAFILLVMRPSVLFAPGFQLSYLAVLYIIGFNKPFIGLLGTKSRTANYIWQSVLITVLAQAGTLPLTVTLFNRFPTWFILSNVIILPVATLALISGLALLLLFPLVFASEFIAIVLNRLVWLTEHMTETAATLPLSTIENIGMTTPECLALIIAITAVTAFLANMKKISRLFPLATILLFATTATITRAKTSGESNLIVYNTIGYSTVGVQSGKNLYILSDSTGSIPEVNRHKSVLRLSENRSVLPQFPYLLRAGNKVVLITPSLTNSLIKATSPDIIVLKSRSPSIETVIIPEKQIDALIISNESSLSYYRRQQLAAFPADTVHWIKNDGAFILGL